MEGGPPEVLAWHPMRQGVSDLYSRTQVSQRANERCLDAFFTLDDTTRMAELIRPLIRPEDRGIGGHGFHAKDVAHGGMALP